jgi:hypothetical protein
VESETTIDEGDGWEDVGETRGISNSEAGC